MIRKAERKDVVAIYSLIKELAEYEKAPNEVSNTVEILEYDLFDDTICDAIVAEDKGEVVGFALYYTSYSTWKGRSMYLEDFYVTENMRGKGLGQKLFDEVIAEAKRRKVQRMDWQVLEWNQIALDFYNKNGALLDPEWLNGRMFF
jgi:GNAT superfamily N-acetyltransferase